jgi:hypothetical protein
MLTGRLLRRRIIAPRLVSTSGSLRSFVPDKGWTCRELQCDPVCAVHAPGYRLGSFCSAPAE